LASMNPLFPHNNPVDIHYMLLNNIVLSNGSWEPMGALQGHLDGASKIISNLHITDMSNIYQTAGLFRVNIGSIKNLNVKAHIHMSDNPSHTRWVGVLAGVNLGIIKNCTSSGIDGGC